MVIRQKKAENSPRTTCFHDDQMKGLLRADSSTARTRRRSTNPAGGQQPGRRAHVKMCRRCGVIVVEEQQAGTLVFWGRVSWSVLICRERTPLLDSIGICFSSAGHCQVWAASMLGMELMCVSWGQLCRHHQTSVFVGDARQNLGPPSRRSPPPSRRSRPPSRRSRPPTPDQTRSRSTATPARLPNHHKAVVG